MGNVFSNNKNNKCIDCLKYKYKNPVVYKFCNKCNQNTIDFFIHCDKCKKCKLSYSLFNAYLSENKNEKISQEFLNHICYHY